MTLGRVSSQTEKSTGFTSTRFLTWKCFPFLCHSCSHQLPASLQPGKQQWVFFLWGNEEFSTIYDPHILNFPNSHSHSSYKCSGSLSLQASSRELIQSRTGTAAMSILLSFYPICLKNLGFQDNMWPSTARLENPGSPGSCCPGLICFLTAPKQWQGPQSADKGRPESQGTSIHYFFIINLEYILSNIIQITSLQPNAGFLGWHWITKTHSDAMYLQALLQIKKKW